MSLQEINTLLGFATDANAERDEKLTLIIANVEKQLKGKLGGLAEVPDELDYIITEVAIIRYNRIGSEGMASESVEGHSATYTTNDFAAFETDVRDYLDRTTVSATGKVRFI